MLARTRDEAMTRKPQTGSLASKLRPLDTSDMTAQQLAWRFKVTSARIRAELIRLGKPYRKIVVATPEEPAPDPEALYAVRMRGRGYGGPMRHREAQRAGVQ